MSERTTIVAWAVGSMKPARMGAYGYCASVWAISRDGGQTFTVVEPEVSKEPNRDEWQGVLKAVIGGLEDVEPGAIVTVQVVQERIAQNYLEKWSNRLGKPHRYFELAQDIFRLRDEKRLTLSIVKHAKDATYDGLVTQTTAAAVERNSQLSDAERWAVPDMPGARPGFGPVGEEGSDLSRTRQG